MIDIGLSKMALIGAVALIVIGPEKLPRVARTVGTLLGKAQRYVADVKSEVNRSMELDELRKMKDSVENAARDVEQSIQTSASDLERAGRLEFGIDGGRSGNADLNQGSQNSLGEVSGIVASTQYPGFVWMHRDGFAADRPSRERLYVMKVVNRDLVAFNAPSGQ